MRPLRIAVHAQPALTNAERRILAALLLRTRIPVEISDAPSAQFHLSIDAPREGATVLVRADLLRAGETLPGAAKAGAPRDDHQRPLPPGDGLPPSVDEMGWALRSVIIKKHPQYGMTPPEWRFCLTFDLDSAGMFHGTNSWHTFRQLPKTPAKYIEFLRSGFSTALGTAPDPHLPFDFLLKLLKLQEIPATFFVQTHREHKLDSYDLTKAGALRRAIGDAIKHGHAIGLHSSYATRDRDRAFFRAQWKRLREVFGDAVGDVHRAHYLRTFDNLSDYDADGPLIDSSLMYGRQCGFRHGTSLPFRVNADLVEIPPCVMDTTLRYHENLGPEQAVERGLALMDTAKKFGGVFTIIWHPHNLNNLTWEGWAKVLFSLIGEAKRQGARFQTLADATRDLQDQADEVERALSTVTP
ncbi:hypothetical protein IT570_10545 [Candidatus Sumerlaeota bacterium]|nr:hypothetical protein [Candidatus Sumerlaeota bacterium]